MVVIPWWVAMLALSMSAFIGFLTAAVLRAGEEEPQPENIYTEGEAMEGHNVSESK